MRSKFFLPLAAFSLIFAGCSHASSDSIASKPTGPVKTVEMTAQGFVPADLEVATGTTVEFVNKDTEMHWPASGIHPTHQVCAGFDALKGIPAGESYSYTFSVVKTCPFHDHINPGLKGTIVVK